MDRRTFIAGALVPLAASGAVWPSGRKVRIGFLGGSHSHASGKVKLALKSSELEIVGMWEEDAGLKEKYSKMGVRLVSLEELLGDPSIDVIAVESAVRDHARHGLLVLKAGKHLHLEKPPALDVESFREMQDLAASKKLVLQMGYMWRHHPGINRMLEAARKGWMEDIYLVKAEINKTLGGDRRPAWAEFRGGQMFELGPHVIDPMIRLMGRPDRVTPFLKKHGKFADNMADNTVAMFEFPGALGIVIGTALQPNSSRYRSFTVYGTLGTATLKPIESPVLEMDLAKAAGPYPKGPHMVELPEYQRYEDDLVELAAAVRGDKPIAVTQREDLMVQEALIMASGM